MKSAIANPWVTNLDTSMCRLATSFSRVGVLDGDVGSEPVGQPSHDGTDIAGATVEGDVGAEAFGRLQPRIRHVHGNDLRGAEELGPDDGGQPDRPGDDDGVTGHHRSAENPHFVARRGDVGQQKRLLVGESWRHGMGRVVREWHAHVLGLCPVDLVAEDPTTATETLAVASSRQ